ncbi:MAG: HlyD family efflux transporter periplasmic adaptor subunit [Deltaproteobacteria bacterium]|nr:HlyD family efflux transporter periplasmic adaptor subunit [Deltaproteobacteria bacterium]
MEIVKRRTLSVSIIIIAVVLVTGYGLLPGATDVDLVNVFRGPLQVTIEEEGRTRLKERFVISAPTSGVMRRIDAKVGDPVQQGQTVAMLEPVWSQALDPRSRAEAEAGVSAATAALKAAREKERAAAADTEYLEKKLERITDLHANGYVAKDQFDQAVSEVNKARALRHSAEAAVDVSRFELDRTRTSLQSFTSRKSDASHQTINILSPITGTIFRIYRESEGTVGAAEPLMDVGNVENLEVRVEVLSSDAVRIKKGTPVLFKRWGGAESLSGAVRVVEPAGFTKISSLGVEEQRVLIIADILSPPDKWRALGDGYRLEAHFVVLEAKDVLQVPNSALFRSEKDWAVFVSDKGKARKRLVEVGQRNGFTAEILSGIHENEKVIAHPDESIGDGSRIQSRK